MNSREKVLEVDAQITAILAGEMPAALTCPFCGVVTEFGVPLLCCEELSDVVLAVVQHLETKKALEVVDRVMNRLN
jgi:hypothetical protein